MAKKDRKITIWKDQISEDEGMLLAEVHTGEDEEGRPEEVRSFSEALSHPMLAGKDDKELEEWMEENIKDTFAREDKADKPIKEREGVLVSDKTIKI